MNFWAQLAITIVGSGALGILLGRLIEKRKETLQARAMLLEPVEEWIDHVTRLVSIVGDEQVAMTQSNWRPMMYDGKDRTEVGKYLGENKEKVLGIMESNALSTRGTKRTAKELASLIPTISRWIESQYLPTYHELSTKIERKGDPGSSIVKMVGVTVALKGYIQDTHRLLAQLKTVLH